MAFGLNTFGDIFVNCIFYFQHELLFYLFIFAFNALPIFNELHALQHAFVYLNQRSASRCHAFINKKVQNL